MKLPGMKAKLLQQDLSTKIILQSTDGKMFYEKSEEIRELFSSQPWGKATAAPAPAPAVGGKLYCACANVFHPIRGRGFCACTAVFC